MSVRKHGLGAGLVMVALLSLLVVSAASGRSDRSDRSVATAPPKLGKHDRALLAQARAAGESTVMLLLAAKDGQNAAAVAALEGAGAKVEYRSDDVSYLRVSLPIDSADVVETIDSIQAADVDEVVPLPDPSPEASAPVTPQPAPGAATPNDNAYMPIGETGSSAFLAAHPTWDGRGVRIGIIDTGIDLHHPSLQTTSTGERKIVDWVAGTHPATDNDPTWLESTTDVVAKDGKFTVTIGTTPVTYTAPGNAGHFFWSVFNERDARFTGSEYANDVNRDGNPAGSSGLFGVIRDGDRVWVDTDQDLSFADETGMRQYSRNFQVSYFGTDNPATPVREAVPFVVQVEHALVGTPAVQKTYVNIGIVSGFHGSHVAGIAAGNSLFGWSACWACAAPAAGGRGSRGRRRRAARPGSPFRSPCSGAACARPLATPSGRRPAGSRASPRRPPRRRSAAPDGRCARASACNSRSIGPK